MCCTKAVGLVVAVFRLLPECHSAKQYLGSGETPTTTSFYMTNQKVSALP